MTRELLIWTALSLTAPFSLSFNSAYTQANNCKSEQLFGDWIFINMYTSRLAKIDGLNLEPVSSRNGTPAITYNKSGTYIDNHGDYTTTGKYIVDERKCLIKLFTDNKKKEDTLVFEITYLDSKYLLFADYGGQATRTFFYKRKE